MRSKITTWMGRGFIIIGVLCNEWILARLISPDATFGSFSLRVRINSFDIFLIITGFYIIHYSQNIRWQLKNFIVLSIGWLSIASGILINEWAVAKIFHLYDTSAAIMISILTIINIGAG